VSGLLLEEDSSDDEKIEIVIDTGDGGAPVFGPDHPARRSQKMTRDFSGAGACSESKMSPDSDSETTGATDKLYIGKEPYYSRRKMLSHYEINCIYDVIYRYMWDYDVAEHFTTYDKQARDKLGIQGLTVVEPRFVVSIEHMDARPQITLFVSRHSITVHHKGKFVSHHKSRGNRWHVVEVQPGDQAYVWSPPRVAEMPDVQRAALDAQGYTHCRAIMGRVPHPYMNAIRKCMQAELEERIVSRHGEIYDYCGSNRLGNPLHHVHSARYTKDIERNSTPDCRCEWAKCPHREGRAILMVDVLYYLTPEQLVEMFTGTDAPEGFYSLHHEASDKIVWPCGTVVQHSDRRMTVKSTDGIALYDHPYPDFMCGNAFKVKGEWYKLNDCFIDTVHSYVARFYTIEKLEVGEELDVLDLSVDDVLRYEFELTDRGTAVYKSSTQWPILNTYGIRRGDILMLWGGDIIDMRLYREFIETEGRYLNRHPSLIAQRMQKLRTKFGYDTRLYELNAAYSRYVRAVETEKQGLSIGRTAFSYVLSILRWFLQQPGWVVALKNGLKKSVNTTFVGIKMIIFAIAVVACLSLFTGPATAHTVIGGFSCIVNFLCSISHWFYWAGLIILLLVCTFLQPRMCVFLVLLYAIGNVTIASAGSSGGLEAFPIATALIALFSCTLIKNNKRYTPSLKYIEMKWTDCVWRPLARPLLDPTWHVEIRDPGLGCPGTQRAQFCGPIVDPSAIIIPDSCLDSSLRALETRQALAHAPVSRSREDLIEMYVQRLFPLLIRTDQVNRYPVLKWIAEANWSGGKRKEVLSELQNFGRIGKEEGNRRKTFTKKEVGLKASIEPHNFRERCIQGCLTMYNIWLGPWVYAISKYVKNNWNGEDGVIHYACRSNEKMGALVTDAYDRGLTSVIESDFSKFDSHQDTRILTAECDMHLQLLAGDGQEFRRLFRYQLHTEGGMNGFDDGSYIRYSGDGRRASGVQNTSIGNTLVNAMAQVCCLVAGSSEAQVVEWIKGRDFMFHLLGDDMLFQGRPEVAAAYKRGCYFFDILGLPAEVIYRDDIIGATFLRRTVYSGPRGFNLLPMPGRILQRSFVRMPGAVYNRVERQLYVRVVAEGLLHQYRGVPVMHELLEKLIELTSGVMSKTSYKTRQRFYRMVSRRFLYSRYCELPEDYLLSEEGYEEFRDRYSLTDEVLGEALKEISSLQEVETLLTSRAFWSFHEVDNQDA
jgi:hypothetical protein